jgi:hypothetical protein
MFISGYMVKDKQLYYQANPSIAIVPNIHQIMPNGIQPPQLVQYQNANIALNYQPGNIPVTITQAGGNVPLQQQTAYNVSNLFIYR